MKKKLIIIISAIVAVAIATAIVLVCVLPKNDAHTHDYDTAWSTSATHHWHECKNDGCDAKEKDKATHSDGNGDGKCDICQYSMGGGSQTVAVESITFNKSELTLDVNAEETLIVTYTPTTATDKKVTWASSAPNIASVDNTGKVRALTSGTATITAETANGKTATCSVIVNAPHVHDYDTAWSTNATHHWHECCGVGECDDKETDKATHVDTNSDGECDACGYPMPIAVESIALGKTELTLNIGEYETLTVTFVPTTATDKNVAWTSSEPAIASVDNAGKITAVSAGTATVTATTANNKTASCVVTVNTPHTHSLTFVPATEESCTKDGNTAYYTCDGCGKWFSDENGAEEIVDKTVVVIEKRHNLTLVPAVAANCQEDGNTAYYTCSGCDKWFVDGNGTVEIEDKESVVTPKGQHAYISGVCSVCGAKKPTEGLEYAKSEDGTYAYVKSRGTSNDTNIVIASEYEGLPVTSIGKRAFEGRTTLRSITIPDSVTIIEERAFDGCTKLTSVIIPDSVTNMERFAFRNCESLARVTISDNLTILNDAVFMNCKKLTSVLIPEGVTRMGASVFSGCSELRTVILPKSLTYIGGMSFDGTLVSNQNVGHIYYNGAASDFANIEIDSFESNIAKPERRYYYSEAAPIESGNYWHFDTDGITPVIWTKET